MTLEVKKIFVDSRFCTSDSISDSDFKIQLARNVYLPEKCVMHIENITMPHSWYSIETGINNLMYVKLGTTCYIATIPSTNYIGSTFATAAATALGNGFTISYEINTNRLTISNSSSFKIN
jgi:hypothetical protein